MAATIGLSGCTDALQEHYEGTLQGLVPIEIHSEAENHYDVTLEAYKPETNRQTYDESYTITANQSVSPPHLEASEQHFRVTKFEGQSEEQTTEEATITQNTKSVTVTITDDDLTLELSSDDGESSGPTAEPGTDGPETDGPETSDPEPNESAGSDGGPNETDSATDTDE
ncbi:hypothetical protein HYG81_00760 [Natrinema zhouii]|uniref:Uncharacterized protein n=1 Tax=Natrinema zhouii TaxID=1710539 RepID=A0A7D6CR36_9EURY|nr:hypothetical protein [Natrinema zhouii]QLK27775.1 hypothetical protein HYG81_00760 [Natrinema zhouii]